MQHDNHFIEFNFKFSQCHLLDESTPTAQRKKPMKKKQESPRPMNVLEENVSFD
jgi:hypothetical protein